ncbi:MAG: hypothetical protein J1E95_09380 [Muribaculaceae bacterium]|nr:hypothetical protein [Muribaculaceae bacterium]
MKESNQTSENNKQERSGKERRYLWATRIVMLLTCILFGASVKCPKGSTTRELLDGLTPLSILILIGFYSAYRWYNYKKVLTHDGSSEGFSPEMVEFASKLKQEVDFFLKKKTRTEQNQQLIIQHLEEMKEKNSQTGERIESQMVSLRKEVAGDAYLLAAIREDNAAALKIHCEQEKKLEKEIASLKLEIQALRSSGESDNGEHLARLEKKLDETKEILAMEQDRIDRLEEEKEALSKKETADYTFRDLLTARVAKRKSPILEKMAREIAAADMGEKREYVYELAKFYRAMLDLGYIRDNQTKFALLFHRDYGGGRDIESYRRSFRNAVDRLIDYEYEDIRDEIEEILND